MDKEDRVKKQHYVPRGYLKNFCNNTDGRIWLFDKVIQKPIGTNIFDIAQEKFFYDLPSDVIKCNVDSQFVEKGLRIIEDEFAKDLRNLIRNANSTICLSVIDFPMILNDRVKDSFSHQLALLKLRTKEFRIMAQQMNQKIFGFIANQNLQHDLQNGKAPKELVGEEIFVTTKPGYEAYEHVQMAFNPDILDSFSNIFFDKIWILGHNTTNRPFYCSDNPISMFAHKTLSGYGVGLGSPWVELCLPLDSEFILIMLDRITFQETHALYENKIIHLDGENVDFYNSLIFRESTRQIYCEQDSFGIACRMLKDFPALAEIHRKRII